MKAENGSVLHLCEFSRVMLDGNPELRKSFDQAARSLATEYRKIHDTVKSAPRESAALLESGPKKLSAALLQILLGTSSAEIATNWAIRETDATKR